jgi:Uma2 family endonuclease
LEVTTLGAAKKVLAGGPICKATLPCRRTIYLGFRAPRQSGPRGRLCSVRATLQLPRTATYADYLAVERQSAWRHELIDGVIVAMAGGPDEHNAIAGRFAMLLGMRLRRACRYYTPDQRFWIAARGRSRYADGSIICGKPEHPPHDDQATSNPTLVLEVLSPSTEGDDAGDKREDFQPLATLDAYILAAQDQRSVKVFRRGDDGRFRQEAESYASGESFSLPELTAPIAVDEIYDDILDTRGRSLLR